MDTFKRPELADRQWVSALLAQENSRACEQNFPSIYLWSAAYSQKISRVGDRLLVRVLGSLGLSYLFPLGAGPLAPALDAVKTDAAAHGAPMKLICLTADQRARLEAEFPGRFVFTEDRDSFDYLYNIDQLADLSGKKLHAKRNHISRFCDQFPNWMFEPINAANSAECAAFELEWFRRRQEAGRTNGMLEFERDAVLTALEHRDALGVSGGLIRADGRVLAFSLGSLTTADCYDVYFEKALGEIQGAYPVINREMARWVRSTWPSVVCLNRENDMGLEGLRKSKLSYHPSLLLEKYSARESPTGRCLR